MPVSPIEPSILTPDLQVAGLKQDTKPQVPVNQVLRQRGTGEKEISFLV